MHAIQDFLLLAATCIPDRKATPAEQRYQNTLRFSWKEKRRYSTTTQRRARLQALEEENYNNGQLYKMRHSTGK